MIEQRTEQMCNSIDQRRDTLLREANELKVSSHSHGHGHTQPHTATAAATATATATAAAEG